MTNEMYIHCLKHTPEVFQQELTESKDKIEAIIALLNWNNVYGCFNSFNDMHKFVDKYDKQATDKGHWSFNVIQVNPNADFRAVSIWSNVEYIK